MDPCIAHKRHLNSCNSSLLKLPARVKERIYTCVLALERPVDLNKKSVQRYMSLLKVCAHIRRKATPIFYSKNTFRISNIFSEAVNFLKHAGGRIPKLYLNFEAAPNKTKTWTEEHRIKLMQRVQMLPGFLFVWDVNSNAVIVEKPRMNLTYDSARDYLSVVEACDEFQRVFQDLSSPQRAGDVREMKLRTRDMTEKMNKMKVGMTEEEAIMHGAAFYNVWKNTHIPTVDDEKVGESKKSKKKAKRTKKSKTNAENRDLGDGDADQWTPRMVETGGILHCI